MQTTLPLSREEAGVTGGRVGRVEALQSVHYGMVLINRASLKAFTG